MTLTDILTGVSAYYDLAASAPATTTDDYSRRIKLVNMHERNWASVMDYRWRALRKTSSVTITAGNSQVALPADMPLSGLNVDRLGTLTVGTTDYLLVRPENRSMYETSTNLLWITTDDAGNYLNMQPVSTSNLTFTFDYYTNYLAYDSGGTEKACLTTGTDVTKCQDPNYLIYATVADLYSTDEDPILAEKYKNLADTALVNMVASENAVATNFAGEILTEAEILGGANIGEE